MERQQLKKWRHSTKFYCPQCNLPVRLKVGDIVIPHFAHEKDINCSISFSEGESKEHLEGKQQLYEFFQDKVDKVALEPYFKQLSQRPDILLTTQSNFVPIEFQCSTIPVKKIEDRTKGYLSAGMNPIWIMSTPEQFSTLPQGVCVFHFSKFQQSFFTSKSPEGVVLFTYNPQNEKFHYFSSLLHIGGRRYIGLHRTLPKSIQTYPFARPKIPTKKELEKYVSIYLSSRKNFLKSRVLLNRRGIRDPFLRSCYDLRIVPEDLPLWIGLPIPFADAFQEHVCEWQTRLVHFILGKRVNFSNVTEGLIRTFLESSNGYEEGQVKACRAYCEFLAETRDSKSLRQGLDFNRENIVQLFKQRFLANST